MELDGVICCRGGNVHLELSVPTPLQAVPRDALIVGGGTGGLDRLDVRRFRGGCDLEVLVKQCRPFLFVSSGNSSRDAQSIESDQEALVSRQRSVGFERLDLSLEVRVPSEVVHYGCNFLVFDPFAICDARERDGVLPQPQIVQQTIAGHCDTFIWMDSPSELVLDTFDDFCQCGGRMKVRVVIEGFSGKSFRVNTRSEGDSDSEFALVHGKSDRSQLGKILCLKSLFTPT